MSRQVREAPNDLVGLLDHRKLVVADGYKGRTHRSDVGRLADRVYEKTGGDGALEPSKRDLFPHCGISLESGDRYQVEVKHRELGKLRDT
jgi:hypothetical protein